MHGLPMHRLDHAQRREPWPPRRGPRDVAVLMEVLRLAQEGLLAAPSLPVLGLGERLLDIGEAVVSS